MKILYILTILLTAILSGKSQQAQPDARTLNFSKTEIKPGKIPNKASTWVFILAGQSNMAGRGMVEPQDTIPNERILTINSKGELILAKEPLHFYEPTLAGLDCGLSFAKELLTQVPNNINIVLIPTAVGGSSISQWLGDSTFRSVKLYSNFTSKVNLAKQYGQIKGILWHQGESDSNEKNIPVYGERLQTLFSKFRKTVDDNNLSILIGELGSYSENKTNWLKINEQINTYAKKDKHVVVVPTADFVDKGDKIHFNSEGQRTLGKRFAVAYLRK
jgi:hypothetical protein